MPPPLPVHTMSDLESAVNFHPNGKLRKPPVNLRDCNLKELVQYKCNISIPTAKNEGPTILCQPVVRLLRQCENGLTVETTAWEGHKVGNREG